MFDWRIKKLFVDLETAKDDKARLVAAEKLGESADPRAVIALTKALKTDSDYRVRRCAASALGNFADSNVLPALCDALQSYDDDLVIAAVESLTKLRFAGLAHLKQTVLQLFRSLCRQCLNHSDIRHEFRR